MNEKNIAQVRNDSIKVGTYAFFADGVHNISKKNYIPVTIKFLKDDNVILFRGDGATVKKDTGGKRVFSLSKAIKTKSLIVFDENLIKLENVELLFVSELLISSKLKCTELSHPKKELLGNSFFDGISSIMSY